MLREIEADMDVDLPIDQLSTGQGQMVQIAAALGNDDRVERRKVSVLTIDTDCFEHRIDAASHSRDAQFEEQTASQLRERGLEEQHFLEPGIALAGQDGEVGLDG